MPLIVLTADRPPELREVGAGQTIDQLKLYGDAAKWFFEVGTHRATPERLRWIRQLAFRASETAASGRPGAVHLNFALREPLVLDEPLPAGRRRAPAPRRAAPRRRRRSSSSPASARSSSPAATSATTASARRCRPRPPRLGTPLLADPLSGARRGPAAVAHYDDAAARRGASPPPTARDTVIRIGDLPTCKPLRQWLAGLDGPPGRLRSRGRLAGPGRRRAARCSTPTPPRGRGRSPAPPRASAWLDAWRRGRRRRRRGDRRRARATRFSEPAVARALAALPSEVTVFTASSMPVRDVESFWPARDAPPRVLAHRGANGIDGTLAAAFGAAAAGGRVVVHLGDVALAHDLGALLSASRLKLALTVVLVDNAGGGIFDFLPVASQTDAFEEHVATPTGLDAERVAALFGLDYERVDDARRDPRGPRDAAARPHRPRRERGPAPSLARGRRRPARSLASSDHEPDDAAPHPTAARATAAQLEGHRPRRHRRGRQEGPALPRASSSSSSRASPGAST